MSGGQHSNVGTIVGSVVGVVVALLLASLAILLAIRWKRNSRKTVQKDIEITPISSGSTRVRTTSTGARILFDIIIQEVYTCCSYLFNSSELEVATSLMYIRELGKMLHLLL
jgi:hypothetical protein